MLLSIFGVAVLENGHLPRSGVPFPLPHPLKWTPFGQPEFLRLMISRHQDGALQSSSASSVFVLFEKTLVSKLVFGGPGVASFHWARGLLGFLS